LSLAASACPTLMPVTRDLPLCFPILSKPCGVRLDRNAFKAAADWCLRRAGCGPSLQLASGLRSRLHLLWVFSLL
jgi:hypothetical protein